MYKNLKKCCCIVMGCILFLLSGCSIDTSSTLEIAKDEVGKRIVETSVKKKTVDEEFQGGKSKLDAVIAANCPKEITYSSSSSDTNYQYTFQLSFSSLEDYRTKVQTILGDTKKVEIKLDTPDTIFASGVSIEENFTSKELSKWFIDAVNKEKLAKEIDSSLSFSDIKVIYDGKEYQSYNKVSVNEQEHQKMERVSLETTLQEHGGYLRSIQYALSNDTYEEMKDELPAFLETCVPKDGKGVWLEENKQSKTYQIDFTAKNIEELIEKTKVAVKNEDVTYTVEDFDGMNPISRYQKIKESINLSSFGINDSYKTSISSKLTGLPNQQIESQSSYGKPATNVEERQNRYATGFSEEYVIEEIIPVSSMTSLTKIKNENQVEKKISILYEIGVEEESIAKLDSYFKEFSTDKIETKISKEGNLLLFTISIEGSLEQVNEALLMAFGEGNQISYQYVDKNKLKASSQFSESINLSKLKGMLHYQEDINFQLIPQSKETIDKVYYNKVEEQSGGTATTFPHHLITNYQGSVTLVENYLIVGVVLLLLFCGNILFISMKIKKNSVEDGIAKESYIKKFLFYQKKVSRNILGISKIVLHKLMNLEENFIPSNVRKPAYHYFYGRRWPIIITMLAAILLFITFFLLPTNKFLLLFKLIIFILPFIIVLIYVFTKISSEKKWEEAIDEYRKQDKEHMKEKAMKRLGLVQEEITILDSLYFYGPALEIQEVNPVKIVGRWKLLKYVYAFLYEQFHYIVRLKVRIGSDQEARYNLIQNNFIFFTKTQVYTYNFLYDVCSGVIFQENSNEFHYRDLITFTHKSIQIQAIQKFQKKTVVYDYVSIISRSGLENKLSFSSEHEIIIEKFMAMRHLIRNEREERGLKNGKAK